MKKETYEKIEALTSKTIEAHEYGDETKVIGEDEALELIKICKAFQADKYMLKKRLNFINENWEIKVKKVNDPIIFKVLKILKYPLVEMLKYINLEAIKNLKEKDLIEKIYTQQSELEKVKRDFFVLAQNYKKLRKSAEGLIDIDSIEKNN